MHPNPSFHSDDRALAEALIGEVGFGMVFLTTPDGPRVSHTPLLSTGDGAVQFHLSRGSALTRHLAGSQALMLVNGPDGYVSPRWYSDPNQVPTWNYVALELEGPVRRMEPDGTTALLDALTARHEARVEDGTPWTRDKMDSAKFRQLLGAIVGFEMEVRAWRPTLKLSQNKSETERARLVEGLEASGQPAIARLMRELAP
jgi:transcriptional regulator